MSPSDASRREEMFKIVESYYLLPKRIKSACLLQKTRIKQKYLFILAKKISQRKTKRFFAVTSQCRKNHTFIPVSSANFDILAYKLIF